MHQQSRGMFTPDTDSQIEGGGGPSNKGRVSPLPLFPVDTNGLWAAHSRGQKRMWCHAKESKLLQPTKTTLKQLGMKTNQTEKYILTRSTEWVWLLFFLSDRGLSHGKHNILSTPISNYALTRSHTQQRGTNSLESCNSVGTHIPLYELEQSQAINAH